MATPNSGLMIDIAHVRELSMTVMDAAMEERIAFAINPYPLYDWWIYPCETAFANMVKF